MISVSVCRPVVVPPLSNALCEMTYITSYFLMHRSCFLASQPLEKKPLSVTQGPGLCIYWSKISLSNGRLSPMPDWWWMTCIPSMGLIWAQAGLISASSSWFSAQIGPGWNHRNLAKSDSYIWPKAGSHWVLQCTELIGEFLFSDELNPLLLYSIGGM